MMLEEVPEAARRRPLRQAETPTPGRDPYAWRGWGEEAGPRGSDVPNAKPALGFLHLGFSGTLCSLGVQKLGRSFTRLVFLCIYLVPSPGKTYSSEAPMGEADVSVTSETTQVISG